MSNSEKTELENALTKIRVPRSEISIIIKHFDKLADAIIGGTLARMKSVDQKIAPLKAIVQKIIADSGFRDKFIENYTSAVKSLGYYTPDQK